MKKRSLSLVVAATLLVVLVHTIVTQVDRHRSKARLRAYKAARAAQGEKLTVDELAPHLSVEAQQAGRALMQAAQQLEAGVVLPDYGPTPMKFVAPGKARVAWKQANLRLPLRTNTWEQLAADLEADGEALRQIRKVLKRPDLGFELDYRQGGSLLLPHLAMVRTTAQRLSAAALGALHESHGSDAAANLEEMLTLIEAWRGEPVLVSQLARMSVAQIAFGTTWEALQADGWTDAQLAAIQRRWEALEFIAPARRAVEMERAVGIHVFDRIRRSKEYRRPFFEDLDPRDPPSRPTEALEVPAFIFETARDAVGRLIRAERMNLWLSRRSYADEELFLRAFEAALPAWESMQAGSPLAAAYRQISTDMGEFERKTATDSRYWMTGRLLPSLPLFFRRMVQSEMQRELAVSAIALKRYRLRLGAPAPSLAALVPGFLPRVPPDAMDGGELRYRLNTDGTWILYSVGEDGVDDGADPNPPVGWARVQSFTHGRDAVWPQPATPDEVAQSETNDPGRMSKEVLRAMMKRYGLVPKE